MSAFVERRAAPQRAPGRVPRLVDIMYEGFHALFLLKNGCGPQDKGAFADNMTQFLADVDRNAKAQGIPADDVTAAKYAYCSAVDEIILGSSYEVREAWETRPLQLRVFGDQLAGEHFFHRLEDLRARGAVHVEALEVFHMCLLLGFQGRYALDGRDKLDYLVARLGDEIVNRLRSDLSLWVLMAVLSLAGLGGYLGFRTVLARDTGLAMTQYNDLVKLPPKAANVTITLP